MKILCARHGQSEANMRHEFANRGRKHSLTEKGREQVSALAEQLKEAGVVAIYASPLLRSERSAAGVI